MKAIPFSRHMARAIYECRKNQTRRVFKFPKWSDFDPEDSDYLPEVTCKDTGCLAEVPCPYGRTGDRFTFLTTWAVPAKFDKRKPSRLPKGVKLWSFFDGGVKPRGFGRLRPGRFMPAWLRARMPVGEIKGVSVQHVEQITEIDAWCEGVVRIISPSFDGYGVPGTKLKVEHTSARNAFLHLFYDLNKRAAKGANPWVWVIHFQRLYTASKA